MMTVRQSHPTDGPTNHTKVTSITASAAAPADGRNPLDLTPLSLPERAQPGVLARALITRGALQRVDDGGTLSAPTGTETKKSPTPWITVGMSLATSAIGANLIALASNPALKIAGGVLCAGVIASLIRGVHAASKRVE